MLSNDTSTIIREGCYKHNISNDNNFFINYDTEKSKIYLLRVYSFRDAKYFWHRLEVWLIYATADEADAYMFYSCFFSVFFLFFFCFFPVRKKIWDNRSRERLNGFSCNFYQTIPGKMEFATSCRRLANVDDLRNLRYHSGAITRGRHARRLRYKIMSARMDLI